MSETTNEHIPTRVDTRATLVEALNRTQSAITELKHIRENLFISVQPTLKMASALQLHQTLTFFYYHGPTHEAIKYTLEQIPLTVKILLKILGEVLVLEQPQFSQEVLQDVFTKHNTYIVSLWESYRHQKTTDNFDLPDVLLHLALIATRNGQTEKMSSLISQFQIQNVSEFQALLPALEVLAIDNLGFVITLYESLPESSPQQVTKLVGKVLESTFSSTKRLNQATVDTILSLLSNQKVSELDFLNLTGALSFICQYQPELAVQLTQSQKELFLKRSSFLSKLIESLYAVGAELTANNILTQFDQLPARVTNSVLTHKISTALSSSELRAALNGYSLELDEDLDVIIALLKKDPFLAVSILEEQLPQAAPGTVEADLLTTLMITIFSFAPDQAMNMIQTNIWHFESFSDTLFSDLLPEAVMYGKAKNVFEIVKTLYALSSYGNRPAPVSLLRACSETNPEMYQDITLWLRSLSPQQQSSLVQDWLQNPQLQHSAVNSELSSVLSGQTRAAYDSFVANYRQNLVRQLCPDDSRGQTQLRSTVTANSSPNLDEVVSHLDKLQAKQIEYRHLVEQVFQQLSLAELMLINNKTLGSFGKLARRQWQSDVFRITIGKTGSEARMWSTGIVENIIETNAFKVWHKVASLGIPVAPILRYYPLGSTNKTQISSRFVGMTINQYESLGRAVVPEQFYAEINRQRAAIMTRLAALGIIHGHPHGDNFTVEFIRKDVFDRVKDSSDLNTTAFQRNECTVDMAVYLQNPANWQVVVRLIDWDRATTKANLD